MEKAIVSRIKGDSTLNTLIEGRVFPDVVKQIALFPSVLYSVATNKSQTLDGGTRIDTNTVSFFVYADDLISGLGIGKHLQRLFDQYYGESGGENIHWSNWVDGENGYDAELMKPFRIETFTIIELN